MLISDSFSKDPRVIAAKEALVQALKEYSGKLVGIKGPDGSLKVSYDTLLEQFTKYRGQGLYFPFVGSGIGNGALVELADGSIKYDCICGIGVHFSGHSNPLFVKASLDAALSDTVMQGHLQQNADSLELMKRFCALSQLDHCILTTSGAMACENALKLAFHKRKGTRRIFAFKKCFMGRTLALASVTDKAAYRVGLPQALQVDYLPFYDAKDPEGSTKRTLQAIEDGLTRYPQEYAAACMELIQGESGFYMGTPEYFRTIMTRLRKAEISIIADEVQTFGRTNQLFAFQHFGLFDLVDIVTLGKMSQVCATLYKSDHQPKPGLISQTFTASTSAIRCALALLDELEKGQYFGKDGKIARLHTHAVSRLETMSVKHKLQGPFGIGGMIAFTAFDGDYDKSTAFLRHLFDAGVIAFFAGHAPTRIRLLLPCVAITERDIDAVFDIIEKAFISYPTSGTK